MTIERTTCARLNERAKRQSISGIVKFFLKNSRGDLQDYKVYKVTPLLQIGAGSKGMNNHSTAALRRELSSQIAGQASGWEGLSNIIRLPYIDGLRGFTKQESAMHQHAQIMRTVSGH